MGRMIGRGGDYVDWLEKVDAVGGELAWVSQRKDFPLKTSETARPTRRSATEIAHAVLSSRRVQSAIKLETERRGWPRKAVQAEAKEILDVMAHRMQMPAVRAIGYAIIKVVKAVFDGVFVNSAQLQRIREVFKDDAVVFMPTHRTYMDFLLISLLCFDHDIPLPAIAAGMDFMNSKLLGEALRRCGAFFIRRQFGNDSLYWSIFTEYVQTHLINADHPVEFFVEGARSRSNKSLFPKYGLLQVLLEPYLRGQLFDMVIVPVTINYDKILEESLYAYELLGFPKPKESASGLLKARQILEKRFGRVFVTFAEPISIRKYFGTSLHRSAFVCQPDSQFKVSEKEKFAIKKFGHDIIRIHNENNITSVWPYACTLLLQIYQEKRSSGQREEVSIGVLYDKLEGFVSLSQRLGKYIHITRSIADDLRYYLTLHFELFYNCANLDSSSTVLETKRFSIEERGPLDVHFLERSISRIILSSYSNQMMHDFADLAILCLILQSRNPISYETAFQYFSEMRLLFDHEFVCLPGQEEASKSFSCCVQCLEKASIVENRDGFIEVVCSETVRTLASLILPYVSVYQLTMQTAFGFAGTSVSIALLVGGTQRRTAQLFYRSKYSYLRLSGLSSDPIRNAIASLTLRNALIKQEDGQFLVDALVLHSLARTLQLLSPYDIPFDGQSLSSKL